MDVEQSSTFVHFARGIKSPRDLYTGLADILWSYHSPNSIIDTASDVLTVKLLWDRNADRELWRIDETIYLGAYRCIHIQKGIAILIHLVRPLHARERRDVGTDTSTASCRSGQCPAVEEQN